MLDEESTNGSLAVGQNSFSPLPSAAAVADESFGSNYFGGSYNFPGGGYNFPGGEGYF